tara:strand:- start:301 stop:810 length:510 start_codon:yes stop_codon:yes gene_type:complete
VSLENTELKIGDVSFKGVYIAILFSLATTLGGGVWTASSLYSRLEAVESTFIPNIAPLEESVLTNRQELNAQIELIKQELKDNNVSQLQGKLATLGTNLVTIRDQQEKLLAIDSSVDQLEKDISKMMAIVEKAELLTKAMADLDARMKVAQREIEDLWQGMDYISNPLK